MAELEVIHVRREPAPARAGASQLGEALEQHRLHLDLVERRSRVGVRLEALALTRLARLHLLVGHVRRGHVPVAVHEDATRAPG